MSDAIRPLVDRLQRRNLQLPALRDELLGARPHFQSRTDTEVVLHAFAEWGEDASTASSACSPSPSSTAQTEHRDARARSVRQEAALLHAARRPLCCSRRRSRRCCASAARCAPNYQRLIEWSLYRNAEFGSPETLVEGISALAAGHSAEDPQRPRRRVRALLHAGSTGRSGALRATSRRRPRAAVIAEVDASHPRQRPRTAGQRRAGRHAVQRRHRFEPHHGALRPPLPSWPRFTSRSPAMNRSTRAGTPGRSPTRSGLTLHTYSLSGGRVPQEPAARHLPQRLSADPSEFGRVPPGLGVRARPRASRSC